jgi:uncharacterized protein (DUF2147 family)
MRGLGRWLGGLSVVLGAIVAAIVPAPAAAENLDGYWIDEHGEVILNIGPCGHARCGRVAWLKKPRGPDLGPLRDFRNPDAKLQKRFVCGMTVVSGFRKQADGTWGNGTVYVPDQGMSFSGYAEVLGPNHVKVSGYVLLPIFGSSEVWTRINRQPPSCEEQARMIATGTWSIDTSAWPKLTGSSEKPGAPPVAAR